MTPEVSIVLPTYNGAKYIKESIESCLSQTFDKWELIVINDCSTDDTLKIVTELASYDKRVKVYSNTNNKKLPASLNVGFKKAKGKYLTWTSDDNYYAPDALEKMLAVFKTNQETDFVYADMIVIDEDGNKVSRRKLKEPNDLFHGCCIGACFMYKRKLYDIYGPYNEDMFCAEDYEYWMRLWVHKVKFFHLKEFLYFYRNNSASLTATKSHQVQEKTFQLKLMYWDKAPVGKFKKCLALYKPYKKIRNPNMLIQIYERHPFAGRLIHFFKLKGRI